jgi:hypothetical protein
VKDSFAGIRDVFDAVKDHIDDLSNKLRRRSRPLNEEYSPPSSHAAIVGAYWDGFHPNDAVGSRPNGALIRWLASRDGGQLLLARVAYLVYIAKSEGKPALRLTASPAAFHPNDHHAPGLEVVVRSVVRGIFPGDARLLAWTFRVAGYRVFCKHEAGGGAELEIDCQ